MTSDTLRPSRVVALALMVVGSFFVAQEVLADLAGGRSVGCSHRMSLVALLFWVVWAFLTPAVLVAVHRWPLDAKPIYRAILVHAGVATFLRRAVQSIITFGLRAMGARYIFGGLGAWEALRRSASLNAFVYRSVFTGVFFYSVVVMVYTALRFRTLYVAEQVSAAELATRSAALEAELTRSKLGTLRSQLRPHFLFNTLNAIAVFARRRRRRRADACCGSRPAAPKSRRGSARGAALEGARVPQRIPRNPAGAVRRRLDSCQAR